MTALDMNLIVLTRCKTTSKVSDDKEVVAATRIEKRCLMACVMNSSIGKRF